MVQDTVPLFWPIDVAEHASLPDGLTFPTFVKPMKSFFSIGARRIETAAELGEVKTKWAELDAFFMPLDRLLRRHAGAEIGTTRLIAEGLIKGVQVTVEGHVLCRRGSHSRRGRFDLLPRLARFLAFRLSFGAA